MAKKPTDSFNFDDLDWPDLDLEEPAEQSDDRSPVVKVAKQVGSGAKKVVFDRNRVRKVAKDVLPGAHSNVAGAAFEAGDLLREAYSNIESEATKTKRDVQKSLRRFNQQTKGMFGKTAEGLLAKLAGQDESYYSTQESDEEKRRREVESNLLAVFGEQAKQTTDQLEKNEAKSLRQEVVNKRQFSSQIQVLSAMAGSMSRLVEHTETDWRYKRKALELQLQSNMLMGDVLEQLAQMRTAVTEELRAVVKNTALPEAAKIELTEEFKRVNSQKLMESLGGGIYGGLGDYLGRTGKGINKRLTNLMGNKLRDFRSNVSGGLDAAGEMMRMQKEMKEAGGDDDTIETLIELAGGALADRASNKWSGKAKGFLGKFDWFNNTKGRAENLVTQGARELNYQASLRDTHEGPLGFGIDALRALLDRTTLNSGLQGVVGGPTNDYDEVKMRKLSMRTIVTIIPGLLARIHHEAVKTRTGDDSVPMIKFNPDTGVFTDSRTMTNLVRDRIASEGTAEINTQAVDRIMEDIVDTSELTGGQRKVLRDHIAHLNMRQLPFKPNLIASGKMQLFGDGNVKDKAAVRDLIGKTYGIDQYGEVKGNKDDYAGRVAEDAKKIMSMRYNLNDPRKMVVDMIEEGRLEELMETGAVVERNGQMIIDFDRINEMRFNESAGRGASEAPAYAPKGMAAKADVTQVVNNYTSKTRNTSKVSVRQTQLNSMSGDWSGDQKYNSEYQTLALEEIIDQIKGGKNDTEYQSTALEEIIDVLERGQTMSTNQITLLNENIERLVTKKTDSNETYNSEYQTAVLEEIMDILQDGRQFTNIAGTEGSVPGVIGRAKSRIRKGMQYLKNTNLGKMVGDAKSFVVNRFKKNRDSMKGRIDRVKGKVDEVWADVKDWYKEGEWRPLLEARKLAAKKYIDSATGFVVTKLSKVKGDVLELLEDGSTRVAATYEDLKEGLRDSKGKKFIMDKATQARGFMGGLFNKALGRHAHVKDRIVDSLKSGFGWSRSMLAGIPDVYVVGEDKPRLLAVMAKRGEYIAAGGGEVRTLKDITGAVADRVGNVVLSEEDIAAGLVDVNGDPLEKYSKGLSGLVQRIKAMPGAIKKKLGRGLRHAKVGVKRLTRRIRGAFKGLGGMLKDFTGGIMGKFRSAFSALSGGGDRPVEDEHLDVAYAQLEVQGMILDQMIAGRKKKKRGKWDTDGDGINDGSWRDLLARRSKKKTDSGEKEAVEKKPSKLMGFLKTAFGAAVTAIGSLSGSIFSAIKWLGTLLAGKSAVGALGDIFDGIGGGYERGQRGRPGRGGYRGRRPPVPRGGKFGSLARIMGGIGVESGLGFGGDVLDAAQTSTRKTAARTATAQTAKVVAKQAGKGMLGRLGLQVGLRAAPLLFNPIGLGVAATAAVGYGTYKLYKWWDGKKPRPLQAVRLAQYGVDKENGDMAERYLKFEEWVLENSKANGQGVQTLKGVSSEDLLKAMEDTIGGVEGDPSRAMDWFSYRFMPVFTSWSSATSSMGQEGKIPELDDTLTPVQAATLFEKIRSVASSTRAIGLPNQSDKTMTASQVTELIASLAKSFEKDSLGVKSGDNSAASVLAAATASGTATAKGNEGVFGGLTGRVLGFAGQAIPGLKAGMIASNAISAGFKQFMSSGEGSGGYDKLAIKEGPVDPLRSVRMKVYGLVEMDLKLVNAIIRLECQMLDGVKYQGKNTAMFRGDSSSVIENALSSFGIDTKDEVSRNNFSQWYENRFVPAYLTYMGAAHEAGYANPLEAHLTGTDTKRYHAGHSMVAATVLYKGDPISVWRTRLHPIHGRQPNSNPGSVNGNMESLLAHVKESELSEISGEKGGILDRTQKLVDRITGKLSGMKDSIVNKATSWMPDGIGGKIRSFFGSDKEQDATGGVPGQTGGGALPRGDMNVPGGSYTPQVGGGVNVNFDPAGGKHGNVNDIPMPTGPRGFEAHVELIDAVAKMTGLDPGILAGLFASESSFDSRAVPGTSSAKGLGQFIDTTWNAMVKKYGHLYGIKPGTSANDPRANALMTVMYMKENAEEIRKRLGKQEVTDADLYLAHFLGPNGYETLYKNPNQSAARLLPAAARANARIFYHDKAKTQPRTGAQVIAMQANMHIKNRNTYGPKMHAYVKSRGGEVDPTVFEDKGLAVADIGGARQPTAANNDELVGPMPETAPTPNQTPVLTVDAGGIPQAPGGTSGATAMRTSSVLGSDVSAPPVDVSTTSNTASQVAQKATQTADATQAQTAASPMIDNGVGKELVRLGAGQLEHLKLISEGIRLLVEQSKRPQTQSAVNGIQRGPMNTKMASSV